MKWPSQKRIAQFNIYHVILILTIPLWVVCIGCKGRSEAKGVSILNVDSGAIDSSEVDLLDRTVAEKVYVFDSLRLETKVRDGAEYCKKHKMNQDFAVMVDMSIHSGRNRLFVWDFKGDSIIKQGLCSHGCCDFWWGNDQSKEAPIISNVPESHCSSVGKYKIGKRAWSNFGINIKYELHGLDTSNNNAFKRIIVLHSWEAVPDEELYPYGTPEGWGCPAVSNTFMKFLDKKLKSTSKPVLLWMYK